VTKRRLLGPIACFVALFVAGGGLGAGSRAVDFRQDGNRIVAFGEVGGAALGTDLALSADGNLALVGGFYDDGRRARRGRSCAREAPGASWAAS
jgi:hypothetical protein